LFDNSSTVVYKSIPFYRILQKKNKPAAATAAAVTEAWAGCIRLRDLFPEPPCFIFIVALAVR